MSLANASTVIMKVTVLHFSWNLPSCESGSGQKRPERTSLVKPGRQHWAGPVSREGETLWLRPDPGRPLLKRPWFILLSSQLKYKVQPKPVAPHTCIAACKNTVCLIHYAAVYEGGWHQRKETHEHSSRLPLEKPSVPPQQTQRTQQHLIPTQLNWKQM